MREVQEMVRQVAGSENDAESQKMNEEFRQRQIQMEKEAKERMDALERQQQDLQDLAKEKADELAFELAEAKR